MTELLEIKQRLKLIYARYDAYLIPLLKLLTAFLSFVMINGQIGYMSKLKSPMIALLMALLCSFLPANLMALFGALLICAHAYALSLEVFAITAGILFVMYVLYFRIAPQYGFVLVLTPVAFFMGIPYALPLILGLVAGPLAAVPVACGTILYYLMYYMKSNGTMLAASETEDVSSRLLYLVENVLNNKTAILTILIFALMLVVVYVVHRMNIDYSWQIAIGAGAVLGIVLFLIGSLVMGVKISVLGLLGGMLVSAALALVVEFFVFSVDYSRTEYTQFEDDEYYYYVKAVPKLSISMPEKKVKKISSGSGKKPSRKKRPEGKRTEGKRAEGKHTEGKRSE